MIRHQFLAVVVFSVMMGQTAAQNSPKRRSTVSFTAGACNMTTLTVTSTSSTGQPRIFETNPGVSLAAAFDLHLRGTWSIGLALETNRLSQRNLTGDARYYNLFSLVLKRMLGGGRNGFRPGVGLGRAEFGEIGFDERVHWWASRFSLELIQRPFLLELQASTKIGSGAQNYSVTSDPAFAIRAGLIF